MRGTRGRRGVIAAAVVAVLAGCVLLLGSLLTEAQPRTIPAPSPIPSFTPFEPIPEPSLPPIADHYN